MLVDDYAHHPTEIAATLDAARSAYPGRRIVAVFQPHLYTRTRDFALDFGRALALADHVWVTDIFPAREEPIPGVDGGVVARAAVRAGAQVTEHPELDGLARAVAAEARPGDVIVTLGAGSIERVGPELRAELEAPAHV
jgi:UDP-N-acetylmuramate--alanine ligase